MSWTNLEQLEAVGLNMTPAERLEASEKNNAEAMTASMMTPQMLAEEIARDKERRKKKAKLSSSSHDPVNHPKHYTEHPSGIECIQITEHMGFNLGNALKYIWRADLKNNAIEDLQKAVWYINREIEKRSK